MLNIMLNKGEGAIAVRGDVGEIICDFMIAVRHIYEDMEKRDPDVAKLFKTGIEELFVEAPFMSEDDAVEYIKKKCEKKCEKKKEEEFDARHISRLFEELEDSYKAFIKGLKDEA